MAISAFRRLKENRRIWRAFWHHSRTFSLAARLLPRAVQMPIATLYLFCRRVDTLADRRVLTVGPRQTLDEVYALKDQLTETLAGRPPDELLWHRLADVHDAYQLDARPLHELIDGAVWDLEGRPIMDTDDLVAYANLVGGSVGTMMLPFLLDGSAADRQTLEAPARQLGIAMQITNITRDVGEDLRHLERVYVPRALLRQHGLTTDALSVNGTAPPMPSAYPHVLETVMEAAEERYAASMDGIAALPRRMRLGIRAAARMYREIMNEVRALGYNNLNRRAYVPLPRKLRLILQDDYERRKNRLHANTDGVLRENVLPAD